MELASAAIRTGFGVAGTRMTPMVAGSPDHVWSQGFLDEATKVAFVFDVRHIRATTFCTGAADQALVGFV
jgi:hypothetical protein